MSFFDEFLCGDGAILGKGLEELNECLLEFLLKLCSLLKYVVLTTFLIELFLCDCITEE